MDVKTTFLNKVIEEEVYIEKPKRFMTFNRESHVYRLKRAMYGLKSASHAWYTKIDNYFTRSGFTKSEADVHLYHIVDDLIPTSDEKLVKSCKIIRDEGPRFMHYFLGMEVW